MNDELLDRLWEVYCKVYFNKGDNESYISSVYLSFKYIYDKDLSWSIHIVSKAYLVNIIGVKNNLLLNQLINSNDISNNIIAFEMIYKHYLDNK